MSIPCPGAPGSTTRCPSPPPSITIPPSRAPQAPPPSSRRPFGAWSLIPEKGRRSGRATSSLSLFFQQMIRYSNTMPFNLFHFRTGTVFPSPPPTVAPLSPVGSPGTPRGRGGGAGAGDVVQPPGGRPVLRLHPVPLPVPLLQPHLRGPSGRPRPRAGPPPLPRRGAGGGEWLGQGRTARDGRTEGMTHNYLPIPVVGPESRRIDGSAPRRHPTAP